MCLRHTCGHCQSLTQQTLPIHTQHALCSPNQAESAGLSLLATFTHGAPITQSPMMGLLLRTCHRALLIACSIRARPSERVPIHGEVRSCDQQLFTARSRCDSRRKGAALATSLVLRHHVDDLLRGVLWALCVAPFLFAATGAAPRGRRSNSVARRLLRGTFWGNPTATKLAGSTAFLSFLVSPREANIWGRKTETSQTQSGKKTSCTAEKCRVEATMLAPTLGTRKQSVQKLCQSHDFVNSTTHPAAWASFSLLHQGF